MPTDEIHNAVVRVLHVLVKAVLDPHNLVYRNQETITLDDGEPQPDGAVVTGPDFHFVRLNRKPFGHEVFWIAEVANTTLRTDRGIKLRSYARAGIATYWIVNLDDRVIEVHTDPDPAAPEPTYKTITPYGVGQRVPVVVSGRLVGDIAVNDVLP